MTLRLTIGDPLVMVVRLSMPRDNTGLVLWFEYVFCCILLFIAHLRSGLIQRHL